MSDILDKIQKLMRLAVDNTNENEARNAALKAVKYIHQHKVELRLPGAAPSSSPGPSPFNNPFDPFMDLNEIFRRAGERADAQRVAAAQRAADARRAAAEAARRQEEAEATARARASERTPGMDGGYVYYNTPYGGAKPRYSARRSVLVNGKRHIIEVLSGNSMCPVCHRQISAGTEAYYTTLGDFPGYRHASCHEPSEEYIFLEED